MYGWINEIFTDWLIKDNEFFHDIFLLADNYTAYAVTVKFNHTKFVIVLADILINILNLITFLKK